ncbi:nitroreductase [Actibacterium sp. MT2.3-13A]|uniref:nitroreductase family protein n=1 Tax=Actibacterium sp. MT2.3-13A TaxID=2828332 RepID=UPI001BACAC4B|nr:nitroreductase [Actibacterium sp. MT2.3-13A]
MPDINRPVMEFLLTRRSRPSKTLTAPAPTRAELLPLLTAAARSPDHGALAPWRFIVLQPAALARLADLAATRAEALGIAPEQLAKTQASLRGAPLAVAVIAAPKPSEKIPAIEQLYSAGAVCLALLNAAHASGWGANWLSGWIAHDRAFVEEGLGLSAAENLAGLIHIGTETTQPPERPRPDLDAITEWVEA